MQPKNSASRPPKPSKTGSSTNGPSRPIRPCDQPRPADTSLPVYPGLSARADRFVAATTPADYRWTPPNRRYIAAGLYLPSVFREGIGPIVIGVDTSGSIGTHELAQFAGEISAIAEEAQPESIHVVYCDAAVQSWQQFGSSEPIQLEPKGGGGTDFRRFLGGLNRIKSCLSA
jgi:predicted metal-dependent peptidase